MAAVWKACWIGILSKQISDDFVPPVPMPEPAVFSTMQLALTNRKEIIL